MKIYNETDPVDKDLSEKRISPAVIVTRTRYIYQIHLLVKNFKNRPVNIEYEQKGFDTYHTIELTKSHKDLFRQDGSSIKSNLTLKAHTVENYSYTIKLVF
jgi:hypothetical protein